MSETKTSLLPEALTLENPENKINDSKQCFEKEILPEEFNQDGNNGEKKEEDNDYECEFKLIVKEKFQEKLKNDSTNELFTIIINEIIEERIKRNFVADNDETFKISEEPTVEVVKEEEELKKSQNDSSELERLKAQDEEVKRKIKELMKRRPRKKALTTYELDPNRDKGFILAKRMNEIKQEREKKYILSKKEIEEKKKSLIESQLATISSVENYSMYLAQKGNNRRLRKESEDLRLPILNLSTNQRNQTEISKNSFYDFESHKKARTQKEISEDGKSDNLLKVRYDSVTLSSRSSYDTNSKDKKRNLLREIEVLRKSQKITEKYHNKKMVHDILSEIILNCVKIVESKKEFFHNAPPKPVHQMIYTSKESKMKSNFSSVARSEKFRINFHSKEIPKEKTTINIENVENFETKSNVENSSRISKITQCFEICLSNRSEREKSELEENCSWKNESEVKSVSQSEEISDEEENKSEILENQEILGPSSEHVKSFIEDISDDREDSEQKRE